MSRSPSAMTWRRVVKQAHDGDPRHLLELLLVPHTTSSQGESAPDGFYTLPDDAELRLSIVRALLFGPFKGATSVQELMTKTGWGQKKPSVSEFEVGAVDLLMQAGASPADVEAVAEALAVDGDTLRRRVKKRRQRKDLPTG